MFRVTSCVFKPETRNLKLTCYPTTKKLHLRVSPSPLHFFVFRIIERLFFNRCVVPLCSDLDL
jgi:hypothetical protein